MIIVQFSFVLLPIRNNRQKTIDRSTTCQNSLDIGHDEISVTCYLDMISFVFFVYDSPKSACKVDGRPSSQDLD